MKEIRSQIAYKDIQVRDGFNARKQFKDIEELADSIKRNGLIHPLVVREGGPDKEGNRKFILIAGERRYRALGLLGYTQVEVKIRKVNEAEATDINIAENDERKDLEPLERAERYQFLMKEGKLTQAQLAKKVGRSEAYVSQTLALLRGVAPEVQKAVAEKKITPTIAREMTPLTPAQQREVLKEVEEKKAKTGKAPSLSELKDSIDDKKAKSTKPKRGKKAVTFDHEKIKAVKEAYEGKEFNLRPKQALLEKMGQLVSRLDNPQLSEEKKPALKAQIAAFEFCFGQRDNL